MGVVSILSMNVHPKHFSEAYKETLLIEGARCTSSRPAWWMSCMNRTGRSSKPTRKQIIKFQEDGKKKHKVVHHLA